MPTLLGSLPSDQPAPVGRCQIKRASGENEWQFSNANNGSKFGDGVGGVMDISVTPKYACLWIVRGNIILHGISGGWQRVDVKIGISPADLDGVVDGFVYPCQLYDRTTVEWRSFSPSAMFRLAANTTYTASLIMAYSSGYVQAYFAGNQWLRIMGRLIGEGEY